MWPQNGSIIDTAWISFFVGEDSSFVFITGFHTLMAEWWSQTVSQRSRQEYTKRLVNVYIVTQSEFAKLHALRALRALRA